MFVLALGAAAIAFTAEQLLLPEANFKRRSIIRYEIRKKPRPGTQRQRNLRYIGQGGRIYLIGGRTTATTTNTVESTIW